MAQYLLDTNTCIAVLRNHPKVLERMAAVTPADCAISTITSYELYTGVEKCANPLKERAKVELLLKTVAEAPFESGAAKEAARIRALLEAQANDWALRSPSGRSCLGLCADIGDRKYP